MMFSKAKLFGDNTTKMEILNTKDPLKIKRLGRRVKNFDKVTWDKHKFDIVYKGNMAKFRQNKHLKHFLFSTNGNFVEASPHDKVWG